VSGELKWGAQAAHFALSGATLAACTIPAAWPIVGIMYTLQCDPGKISDAAEKWSDLGDQFGKIADELDRLRDELTEEQWSGGDRNDFNMRMSEYSTRYTMAQVLAVIVSVALFVTAILLMMLILLMSVIAAVLVVFMGLILACLAGVFSAPAAAEIFVEADAIALEAAEVLESASNTVNAVVQGMAGLVTQGMEIDVGGQLLSGDTHLGHDLLQTVLDGKDSVFWGTLSRVEQQVTGNLMKTGDPLAVTKGFADSLPYTFVVPTGSSTLQHQFDDPEHVKEQLGG
jgi:hypothetical protein